MAQFFSEKELACKCCGANGMKPVFLEMLDALRLAYNRPIILNSAFRCEKKNRETPGAAPDSQHLLGLAADISCVDSAERFLLVKLAFSLGFRGIEIGADWVHVDFRAGLERMFLK